MTFTSLSFFLFFTIVLVIYWLLKKREQQNLLLLLASYIFYFYFDLLFGFLMLASSAVDYLLARGMAQRPEKRKRLLWISLILNVGGLVLMRHFGFFASSLNLLFGNLGMQVNATLLAPLGISFYTLKKLSYIIDVYKGTEKPAEHFVDYALFVAFFPQIQAGPIDRARNLLKQIKIQREWKANYFHSAWPVLAGCGEVCVDQSLNTIFLGATDKEAAQDQQTRSESFLWELKRLFFNRQLDRSYLPEIERMTRENDIQLILVEMKTFRSSPSTTTSLLLNRYMRDLQNYCSEHDIVYINFSEDERLTEDLFPDGLHLAIEAQPMFTDMLAEELIRIISQD